MKRRVVRYIHATSGWKWLTNSTREHWFNSNGRSLCGKWATLGGHFTPSPVRFKPCANCARLRLAQLGVDQSWFAGPDDATLHA